MMKYLEMNIKSKILLMAQDVLRFGNKYTKNYIKYKQIYIRYIEETTTQYIYHQQKMRYVLYRTDVK